MAPPRKLSHSCSAGLLPTFRQLQVDGHGEVVAPTPARSPALHRGPITIPHAEGLLRVWGEVRSGALHVYPQRAAALPSLVVAHLTQCRVSLACLPPPSPAHCVLVHRKVRDKSLGVETSYRHSALGREEVRLLLETREEAEVWVGMLQVTAVSRSLQLEGLNLECGAAECFPLGGEGVAGGEGDCLVTRAGEDEDEDVEEEERSTQASLANLIDLLHPLYCGDDVGSGSSCDAESPEEEEEEEDEEETNVGEGGGRGRGLKEGCSTPSLSSSPYTTMVEGTEVRLRHPPRLSPDNDTGRRELLQQMLTTKSLLEKKQKNRRSGAGAWAVTAGEVENEYDRAQHEAQLSALRKAVILRQRKNSTAIKMATLERQQSSKGKKQKQRKQKAKGDGGGGGNSTSGGGGGGGVGGGVGVWAAWDGMGGEASGLGCGGGVKEGDVTHQLEALRRRLSALDCELRESKQDTERTLQDLQQRREQELHLIQDLGGVAGDLPLVGGSTGGLVETSLSKSSNGGSLMGSLSSIPSIVVSSSPSSSSSAACEKKASEKIFGIKVGGSKEGRSKARNPLHFLDLKLRVSRRHKSTECLSVRGATTPTQDRSHNSTPGNGSFSDNSSDEETDHHHQHSRQPPPPTTTHHQQFGGRAGMRTEVSLDALREIESFKQLIHRYFATHPRHDSITSHSREILL